MGQGVASLAIYTQPYLWPVVAAEAFLMNKPHVTGTVQSLVQTAGVAVDFAIGGREAGQRSLASLDKEMKDGKFGALVKGANLVGQELSDRGVKDVLKETWRYWSNVSPGKALADAKATWSFLAN
jgi:hypothetical protein